MVFTSLNFLLFFPIVAMLFYLTPVKYRWLLLLAASYFFYLNIKPVYAVLLAAVTTTTYIFTRLMDKTPDETVKKGYMVLSIILVLLPLFCFKYFGAINHELSVMLQKMHVSWPLPEIHLLLPVGISFYTFMAIGYTIDVYNEEIPAERNLGILALFISFFPLVLSGPIERANNMLPQFNATKHVNYNGIIKGMKMMLWGYFMKLVVADRIGLYVNVVFNDVSAYNGSTLLLCTILYPFQVYADLGGYSLIAIGTAKVLGFNVMQNFRRPFFAVSMAEFWRRWHISLITWITDYVYTPLSFTFRKLGLTGVVLALLIAFLISGIWHGAALTFVAWGLLQGIFLSVEALMSKKRKAFETRGKFAKRWWYILVCCILTFLLFSISQVFARATNMENAFFVFRKLFTADGAMYLDMTNLLYAFIGLGILMLSDFRDEFYPNMLLAFENKNRFVRYASYMLVLYCIIFLGVLDSDTQFIYFKF
jgi:D-alanyl-lipoteichoic acid acyltransferase DltB (MBOAT superfamily)